MAFRMRHDQSVADEARRVADEQLQLAITGLATAPGVDGDRRIRTARRHVKMLRALIRLLQPRLEQLDGVAALRHSGVLALLSTPIIYSIAIPLLLLDAWVTLYQWLCFPAYRIALVRRREYFAIDRHRLPYLKAIEKLHCFYCSYATGVLSYVLEIAARTEQYWCPIRHQQAPPAPHGHYQQFFDYGDGVAYRRGLAARRRQLEAEPPPHRVRARDLRDGRVTTSTTSPRVTGAVVTVGADDGCRRRFEQRVGRPLNGWKPRGSFAILRTRHAESRRTTRRR